MDDQSYTERLKAEERSVWKRIFQVQAPYRWNLRHLRPGRVLDIGCGTGRNLGHLDGNGIGIDVNSYSLKEARAKGFSAMTPEEFKKSGDARPGTFDSILLSHVLEHLEAPEAESLLKNYLPFLKPQGRVIVITPQEAGFKSDPTHRNFMDFKQVFSLFERCGIAVEKKYSFPFPRFAGHWFKYNEFVVTGKLIH